MLQVYNTLQRKKETFQPLHPPFVGIYVCGPTVYDDPHLGHAKSYVSFDVIVRFLRFQEFKVRYVQNITDVGHLLGGEEDGEDRVQKRERLEKLEPIEIAQKYENHFFRDMDRLNCVRPDISSRASGHIPEMIELVQRLLEKEFAYEIEGNIYFDISKFPGYGKLSGRRLEEMKEGTRIETVRGKRHASDFALWKKADAQHIMQWPSPWGLGYPGWHLECSVMSMKYLGESIDIHGGGIDNQFPHHECEIAQSEAVTGQPFVKYWMHNNMVTVDGQKMSKSLGNHTTLEALFEKFHPMTVRFFVLQGHYRSPQDFSDKALDAAQKGFQRLAQTVENVYRAVQTSEEQGSGENLGPWLTHREKLIAFMEDDFNTSGAISVLFDIAKDAQNALKGDDPGDIRSAASLFRDLGEGILGLEFSRGEATQSASSKESELVEYLVQLRQIFRDRKLWDLADDIRNKLSEMGFVIEDGSDGTMWKKSD